MRVVVSACWVPYIGGGARYHLAGLVEQLRAHHCDVETLLVPFMFEPRTQIEGAMEFAQQLDLTRPNGQRIDRVISLQFPGYGLQHPQHIVWLMHQHRAAYELFDDSQADAGDRAFRQRVQDFDRRALAGASARFANSARVAERLQDYLQIEAEPLHHPPPYASSYRGEPAEPYLFYPSRLESLKRQDLLIQAMARVKAPVHLVLAGGGGQVARFQDLARELGLSDRVHFLGEISEAEKIAFYARCLAVCYPTFDEDYGYITLEAMLSSKPILTCSDSGGPLAFVENGDNGYVVAPDPQALAEAIERLAESPDNTRDMGLAGLSRYHALEIRWDTVIERLLDAGT